MNFLYKSIAAAMGCAVMALVGCGGGGGASSGPATGGANAPIQGTWVATGSLQTARFDHTATLLPNGKVLVTGGTLQVADGASSYTNGTAAEMLASAELYDPTTKVWTPAAPMGAARSSHTATLLPNGKVLVAGGLSGVAEDRSTLEVYDPVSNTWTTSKPLPVTVSGTVGIAILLPSGKVMFLSHELDSNTTLYDAATDTWTPSQSMGFRVNGTVNGTLLADGKVLGIAGGLGTKYSLGAQVYDPATDRWTRRAEPPIHFGSASSNLLLNGAVLFVAEYFDTDTHINTALYNPSQDRWILVGDGRSTVGTGHTATMFNNGVVLLVGGSGKPGNLSATSDSVQLYDPTTNTLLATPALPIGPRSGHTATLLRDGSVLITGGKHRYVPNPQSTYDTYPSDADSVLFKLL